MTIDRDNPSPQVIAANELEDLVAPLIEVVKLLRAGQTDGLAYALVYQLRWNLGLVVRRLGEGMPLTYYRNDANDIIRRQWRI